MASVLENNELDIAEKIIYIGMKKASEAMAFFTKAEVSIKNLEINLVDLDSKKPILEPNKEELITVLITHLVGELNSSSFLILSESDTQNLGALCLPEKFRVSAGNSNEMLDALMLEMDNIIVGSVVTQFSNIFKYKVHGDVPSLKRLKNFELNDFIKNELNSSNFLLHFNCTYSSPNIKLTPEFYWLLDTKFINAIKKIAINNNEIETLNSFFSKLNDNRTD